MVTSGSPPGAGRVGGAPGEGVFQGLWALGEEEQSFCLAPRLPLGPPPLQVPALLLLRRSGPQYQRPPRDGSVALRLQPRAWAEPQRGAGEGPRGGSCLEGGAWRRAAGLGPGPGCFLLGSASPHLQKRGRDLSWPQCPSLCTGGSGCVVLSLPPAGGGVLGSLGGGIGWE